MVTITGIKAGTTTITATYGGKTSNAVSFTVSKASRSGAVSCNNVTYGSTVTATVSGNTENGTVTWGITAGTGNATISNTGVVTPTQAGTVTITASVAATENYAAYTATPKTITINQRSVTVTAPTVKSDTIRYTGSGQELLSGAGSVTPVGTMYYYCSTNSNAPTVTSGSAPGTGWSTTAPSKTDVGTYYIWYYAYVSDTTNNTGTNINTVKSLGSKAIDKRIGAAPTFSNKTASATCIQSGGAITSTAFGAATAGHSGSLTYTLGTVTKSGSSTALSGWSINGTNGTSRTFAIPANTLPGTYTATVTANEGETTTDTSSSKSATVTITISKGTQTLTLTNNPSSKTITYPNTGTITASGHAGTISATSATTSVATVSTSSSIVTVSSVGQGTSVITVTAAATDYVEAATADVTWTVNRRTGAAPTFGNSSVTATCSQDQTAKTTSAFTAATAGHGGTLSYSLVSAKNSGGTSLSNWSVNSSNRTIGIPANTVAGTYTVVVKCSEAQTSTDTASEKDATITVTLSKGTQTLTLTNNPTSKTITYPNTGTITASGHVGTISTSSATTSVATVSKSGSTVTVTSVGAGTSVITVTAAANDYVNEKSETVTWTVNRRTGATPTFNDASVTATCVQSGAAVNAGAFTAATAKHSGSITYAIQSVTKSGSSTTLSGWTMTSNTSRIITVPANTLPGTYLVTVRATEGQTSTDTSSTKDAVITVTLSKGTQSLTLTSSPTNATTTYPTGGTITASGHAGTISASSATTSVATVSASSSTVTVTAVGQGTSVITVTAAATDYVESVSKTVTWTINRRTGAAPTFNASSVTATCVQAGSAVNAGAFTAATAGHGGSITYSIVSVVEDGSSTQLTGWTMTSTTSRVITVPASTVGGKTYKVTVRATEGATSTDTSSTKDAVITVTLNKGTQTLNLSKTTSTVTVGGSTDTITASGYAGTLTVTSGTPAVATASNEASSTITAVKAGTSTITFTAAATNYVNAVSKTATVTVNRRTGSAPTFNNSSVTATCVQAGSARTTSAFTAGTATHSGALSYSLVSAKNSGGSTLSGWSVDSSNRTIGIPANTVAGTYTVVVRCTEGQTDYDTSSTKDATITVTLSKGTQTLNLDKTELNLTVPNTGTIKASGYAGTLSVSSGSTDVATASNSATSTITAVSYGSATITFTAAANDYVNEVSKTATVNVSRRTGAQPTFNNSTVTATCSQDQSAKTTTAFTAATAGHGGSLSYSLVSAKNSGGTSLSNWSVTSSTRKINIPANTKAGTYTCVVRCTEAQTSTDTQSTADATITVTLSKGTQSLTLTSNPTNATTTYPNGGTITASGHVGTVSASSGTTSVATVSTSSNTVTVTCVKAGSSVITVTAAANDYVNSVSKTVTWTINKANATPCSAWEGDSKGYDAAQTTPASLTYTGYSGGTIKFRYDVNNGTSWTETTTAPTRNTVGTTAVQYMIVGDDNHNDTSWSETVTLTVNSETDASLVITLTTRTYSGSNQVIATGGSLHAVASYKIGYIRKDIGASAPSQPTQDNQLTWSDTFTATGGTLSAKNAGDYYIYYTMSPGTGHTNTKTREYVGKVTISKASRSGAVSCNNTTYPTTVTATVSGNTESGTVTWGITPGTGTATINSSGVVTPTKAGTVTVTASVAATANYAAYTATSKQITISKHAGSLTYETYASVSQYCTTAASAKSATDSTFTAVTIASAYGSTSTNGDITYTVSPNTWTVQNSGTKVLPSVGTAASTYTVTVTATAAATNNYEAVSVSRDVTVTISANTLKTLTLSIATTTIPYGSSTDVTSLIALYDNDAYVDVKDSAGTTYSAVSASGIVSISKS